MQAILFIDVDGQHSCPRDFLAARLGHVDQVAEAGAARDAGLMTELDANGWAGTTEAQLSGWLAELPLVHGISDLIRWCRDHDVVPALVTLAWRPVSTCLCEAFGS